MTALFFMRAAALSGAMAVTLGAFGAHGLKPHLDEYQIGIWEKAVLYQFVHTLVVLALALYMMQQGVGSNMRWSALLMLLGILMFSGSLYLLAVRHLLPFSVSWAGPVTPIGGLCFIAGWVMLLFKF
jgi:uncharacterized membrane protein YgdD (TMEM256/DUF423 family)